MNLNDRYCSGGLAKQLEKIGFKAETQYSRNWDSHKLAKKTNLMRYNNQSYVDVYDADTLLDSLPADYEHFGLFVSKTLIDSKTMWEIAYCYLDDFNKATRQFKAESLADASAMMLIWAKDKGIVSWTNQTKN